MDIRPPRRHHWHLSICRTLSLRQNLILAYKKSIVGDCSLLDVGMCCKSLASQLLFQGFKKVETTGRDIGAVWTVIRNLPAVPPLRITVPVVCFGAIESKPFAYVPVCEILLTCIRSTPCGLE